MADNNFIKASALSAMSSMFFALFIMFVLKMEYPEFAFFISSFILFIFSYLILKLTKSNVLLPSKSSIITDVLFSLSIILYLYFMSPKNIIILQAIVSFNIIVFVLIHTIRHKDIIDSSAIKFLAIGMVFIVGSLFLFYDFSSIFRSLSFLIISIIIMFLFGVSSYMLSHRIKHTRNKFNFLLWVSLVTVITSSFFLMFNPPNIISQHDVVYSLFAGIFFFLFLVSLIEGYDKIKEYSGKARFSKTIIVSILSETDILFISLFYVMLIGTVNLYVLLGALLLFAGLAIISLIHREKDLVI